MRTAISFEGEPITPSFSGERAVCSCCDAEVVGKCGEIVTRHWSHLSGKDCDSWSEPITHWHCPWQDYMLDHRNAQIEVSTTKNGETHRADAVLPDGRIYEFQRSYLSPEEIQSRENFYGEKLTWVFYARDVFAKNRFRYWKKNEVEVFHWYYPKKSIAYANNKKFLDLGEGKLFEIKKMSKKTPCYGYGFLKYSSDTAYHIWADD